LKKIGTETGMGYEIVPQSDKGDTLDIHKGSSYHSSYDLQGILALIVKTLKPVQNTLSKTKETELERKIKKLRSQLGLTEGQFAAKVGVTFSTINRSESSKNNRLPLGSKHIEVLY